MSCVPNVSIIIIQFLKLKLRPNTFKISILINKLQTLLNVNFSSLFQLRRENPSGPIPPPIKLKAPSRSSHLRLLFPPPQHHNIVYDRDSFCSFRHKSLLSSLHCLVSNNHLLVKLHNKFYRNAKPQRIKGNVWHREKLPNSENIIHNLLQHLKRSYQTQKTSYIC